MPTFFHFRSFWYLKRQSFNVWQITRTKFPLHSRSLLGSSLLLQTSFHSVHSTWREVSSKVVFTTSPSPLHPHHFTLTTSPSPLNSHHFTLTTSLSPLHPHHLTLTTSPSPLHSHHFTLTITPSRHHTHHICLSLNTVLSPH